MKKRLTNEQYNDIEHYRNTFPNSMLMEAREMAILNDPEKFGHVNRARHNKMLADRAEKIFKELAFLFSHLPLYYRTTIFQSKDYKEFLNMISFIDPKKLSNLDDKRRALVINLATQQLFNSISVLKNAMPMEFDATLRGAALPFMNLVKAISDYGHKRSLKDIPYVPLPASFFVKRF